MAEYRRFISYIYAYEGDMKTKNVGFAKIEARNGQCRISISIKGAYECSGGELALYGYGYREADCLLVPLGQIPVKNGTGEAVFGKQEENLGGTGYGLAFLKGLYLRSRNSVRKAYLTTWDDTVVHMAALRKAGIAGEETLQAASLTEAPVQKPLTGMEVFKQVPELVKEEAEKQEALELEPEKPGQIMLNPKISKPEIRKPEAPKAEAPKPEAPELGVLKSEAAAPKTSEQEVLVSEADRAESPEPVKPEREFSEKERAAGRMPENFYFREGFPELPLWECLQKILPRKRILSEAGWEVLQIHIQDIGRLPRENWPYGNNSFVLHGYFQYRYLILARRQRKPEKRFQSGYQYILGVPGIFKPQEKFMASMFGLPEFKRAAGNRTEDFGFWCGSIQM